MRNKTSQLILWILSNSLLLGLIYLAVPMLIVGAGRILSFLAWIMAIGSLCILADPKVLERKSTRGRGVPAWVCHSTGLIVVGGLIWHGWWLTGVAFLLHEIFNWHIYSPDSTYKKKLIAEARAKEEEAKRSPMRFKDDFFPN